MIVKKTRQLRNTVHLQFRYFSMGPLAPCFIDITLCADYSGATIFINHTRIITVQDNQRWDTTNAKFLTKCLNDVTSTEWDSGKRHSAKIFIKRVLITVTRNEDNFKVFWIIFFLCLLIEFTQNRGEATARWALKFTIREKI